MVFFEFPRKIYYADPPKTQEKTLGNTRARKTPINSEYEMELKEKKKRHLKRGKWRGEGAIASLFAERNR